jgi:acyl-CoA reductase-like NAD-dependent aldehyde dehydrogenase
MLRVMIPYRGSVLGEICFADARSLQLPLELASRTFRAWRHSGSCERARLLLDVAAQLEAAFDEFAGLIRDECSKPMTFAKLELTRTIEVCRSQGYDPGTAAPNPTKR